MKALQLKSLSWRLSLPDLRLFASRFGKGVRPRPGRLQVDKILSNLIQYPRMRHVYRLLLLCTGPSLLLLSGCATGGRVSAGGPYHVTAYKPADPSKVRVLVSLSRQNVYVMEGDRCLMAAAISVGTAANHTQKGNFHIYSKQEHKRSGSYGFSVQGNRVVPSTGGGPGRYVGYPMGYWCG